MVSVEILRGHLNDGHDIVIHDGPSETRFSRYPQ
jgi:hypothetical protein